MKTNTKMMFLLQNLNYWKGHIVLNCSYQGYEIRWISVELTCYVKTIIVFYKFYDFFFKQQSLMDRPCYNNLFQITQLSKLK